MAMRMTRSGLLAFFVFHVNAWGSTAFEPRSLNASNRRAWSNRKNKFPQLYAGFLGGGGGFGPPEKNGGNDNSIALPSRSGGGAFNFQNAGSNDQPQFGSQKTTTTTFPGSFSSQPSTTSVPGTSNSFNSQPSTATFPGSSFNSQQGTSFGTTSTAGNEAGVMNDARSSVKTMIGNRAQANQEQNSFAQQTPMAKPVSNSFNTNAQPALAGLPTNNSPFSSNAQQTPKLTNNPFTSNAQQTPLPTNENAFNSNFPQTSNSHPFGSEQQTSKPNSNASPFGQQNNSNAPSFGQQNNSDAPSFGQQSNNDPSFGQPKNNNDSPFGQQISKNESPFDQSNGNAASPFGQQSNSNVVPGLQNSNSAQTFAQQSNQNDSPFTQPNISNGPSPQMSQKNNGAPPFQMGQQNRNTQNDSRGVQDNMYAQRKSKIAEDRQRALQDAAQEAQRRSLQSSSLSKPLSSDGTSIATGMDAMSSWDTRSTVLVQGNSLRTWSLASAEIDNVQVLLKTDGRPLKAYIDVWQGPNYSPQKIGVYVEDGELTPFNAVFRTPRQDGTAVAVRNGASAEYPLAACLNAELKDGTSSERAVEGLKDSIKMLRDFSIPRIIQGAGAVRSFPFAESVTSIQILLKSDGRPMNGRIELLQGPNNNKQIIEVYSEDGMERPFFAIIETPGKDNVVRIINTAALEYPLAAWVEPYLVDEAVANGVYEGQPVFVVDGA